MTALLREIGVRSCARDALGFRKGALLKEGHDVVLFESGRVAEAWGLGLVRRHQPWARIVVDSVDIHFPPGEEASPVGVSDPETVAANKRRQSWPPTGRRTP